MKCNMEHMAYIYIYIYILQEIVTGYVFYTHIAIIKTIAWKAQVIWVQAEADMHFDG